MSALPDISDLASRIQFSPEMGRIWRDGERCVMLSSSSLARMRGEIVARLGQDAASRIFWEIGFAEGARCAISAKELRPDRSFLEAFAVGPQAHALTGFGWTDIEALESDSSTRRFEGRFRVHDSIEAAIHLGLEGGSAIPVCWMQTGFASGFATTFAGHPIVMRELECAGMGDAACLLHARPEAEWPQINRAEGAKHLEGSTEPAADSEPVLGVSAGFLAVKAMVERAATTDATLLFMGETGVGKEVFAALAHRLSRRRDAAFVALNCAALPDGLIEAELFGVAKGGYTGAVAARPGRFELADGGTLFLDEISTLSALAQSKILRAVQEGEFERVGDGRTIKVDVRLIAASNMDLLTAVEEGRFRADLYYRISTLPITVPPLRQRREDIPVLLEHFSRKFARRHGRSLSGFTAQAINGLLMYDFPGNVRELERMVERSVLLVDPGHPIDLRHLLSGREYKDLKGSMALSQHGTIIAANPSGEDSALAGQVLDLLAKGQGSLSDFEELVISEAVAVAGGNVAKAARSLGLTRRQAAFRLEKIRNAQQSPGRQDAG